MDIGVYSLQAARYMTGEEPIEVTAIATRRRATRASRKSRSTIDFQLSFPSGVIASCSSSYGCSGQNRYRVVATKGWFELEPATSYSGLRMRVRRGNVTEERSLPVRRSLRDGDGPFVRVRHGDKEPLTPGEEGLRDLKLMMAIYEAARSGKTVKLS